METQFDTNRISQRITTLYCPNRHGSLEYDTKMKGRNCLLSLMLTTVYRREDLTGVHATSLSSNFSTENFSLGTPTDSCEECINRARDYYQRTVSNPEEFCITNQLCVENPNLDTMPPTLQSTDEPFLPAEDTESTGLAAPDSNDNKRQNSIPVSSQPYGVETMPPSVITAVTNPPGTPTNVESTISAETNVTAEETPSKNAEEFETNMLDNVRTTMSSIFLKNLTSRMDHDVSEIFSIVALDFLRDHSMSDQLSEEVDFVLVKVMGQGQEYGNTTKSTMYIEGINVFFETLVNLEDISQIDLPGLIESIFKENKNDFLSRLAEADDYFIPLNGKRLNEEAEGFRFEFLKNTWATASLAAVAGSVLLSVLLLTRRGRRTRVCRDYKDASKQDTYPLCTLEQTCSEGSTPTNRSGNNPPSQKSDAEVSQI